MSADQTQREAKFVLAEARAGTLLTLLRQRCRPDGAHAANVVSSLYYDTADRRGLYEKVNSDFLKTKVRLRWYTDLDGRIGTPGSFLEVKRRIGGTREKLRLDAPFAAEWLDRTPIHHVDLTRAADALRPLGVRLPALSPLFVIRYERHRFLEPASGLRINLDRRIHVPDVNRRMMGPRLRPALTQAVLEVKGAVGDELPRALHGALRLGCRLSSFSKYAACYLSIFGAVP